MRDREFRERYGPWAVVAGGSTGIGRAFAERLAERGLHLVLIARGPDELDPLAGALHERHGVQVRAVSVDLADDEAIARVRAAAAGLEVGLLVYNAAHVEIRPFFDVGVESHLRTLNVNCRGPLVFAHEFGRPMLERGRGGIVLMSSMAGWQGSALIATYAASKAFDTVLGEGLWEELRHRGVDVLAFVAGATRTPSFLANTPPERQARTFPRDPGPVADEALACLGRHPSRAAGPMNRIVAAIARRVLTRRRAIRFMSDTNRALYGERGVESAERPP